MPQSLPQALPQPTRSKDSSGNRDLRPSERSTLHDLSEELQEGSALLSLLAAAPASKAAQALLKHWSRRMERMSGIAAHVAEQMPQD